MRSENWRGDNKGKSCEFVEHASLHHLIIEVIKQEEKTAGGIIIASETRQKEDQGGMTAKVLAISHNAWADKPNDACDVGDTIVISRYSGTRMQNIPDEREVRIISDLGILAVLKQAD
jgi:co-chaperonin GroES (HSP10)